jgi:TonB-linked SusC/RagA family outer membrane protein
MTLARWRAFAATAAALLLLAPASRALLAQGTITGRVAAVGTGQPVADARVLAIGSTVSTTTGDDGKYTLRNVPAGTVQLQVLRVGFQSQKRTVTLAAGGTATADFELAVAIAQLQEVVTTATGQQRKVELGNAISTLGDVTKRVETVPTHNISDLMIAKSPGVTILPGSELGGAPTVRIRGVSSISLSNAPIWYIDGVRYSAGTLSSGTDVSFSLLNSLNPDEIEDIEIVKGPSAATLYGTNAANGVVVITTKKGRAGNARWNWTGELGNVSDRVPYQAMYANWGHDPKTGTALRCQLSSVQTTAFSVAQGATCISDSLTSYNYMTDKDNTFVHMGNRSLYGMNVSGGNTDLRYFVSGDVENEIGPIQMQDYYVRRFEDTLHIPVRDEWFHPSALQKSSFRANLNASLSPKVDVSVNTGFVHSDSRIPPESDLIIALYYVGMQNYGYKGCPGGKTPCGLDKIAEQADLTPLHDALQWSPGDIMQVTQNSDVQRFTGSSTMTWRPLPWLQNEGTAGIDLAAINFFSLCRLNECPPQSATARLGRITDNQDKNRNFSAKISSNAAWNYRPWLNLKTSIGGDYTNVESDFARTNGTTLPAGASTVAAASTKGASNQQPTAVKTLGAYVQEQASIRDRMFLTYAIRTDQNSAFGTNFQKVYYPKASLSWILSDESFFPHYDWLNQFRVRTAYGASGVQPGATTALALFSAGSVSVPAKSPTATGGTDTPSLTASQPGNADLRPERSGELETGFDAQLLNNRLHFEYTFWNKKTKDALINIPVSASSAAAQLNPLVNIGSTQGWGHEVQANAQLIDRRSFAWDILVTGSHFSNKVVDLGIDPNTGQPRKIGTGQAREIVGLPIFSQWFRPYTYSDDNHDGILQKAEVHVDSAFQYFGYIVPRDIVSIQNGFDLFNRRVRINAMFDYKGGNSTIDGANNFQCNTGPYACRDTQDPTASLDRQAAAIAKTYGSVVGGQSFKTTVGYFRNNQFWKFRELSAVLMVPDAINKRLHSQNGTTLVFGARNIKWWGAWTGIDPEANYGLNSTESQNEFQTTGAPTYFTARLNLKY